MKEKHICIICGKEFETGRSIQKCCSCDCQKIKKKQSYLKYKNKKPELIIRSCIICNKEFKTVRKNQICCGSDNCIKKRHEQLFRKKNAHFDYITEKGNPGFYAIRFFILRRDGFRCQYCGRTPQDNIKLQVDHIIPRIKGGNNDHSNLITSCEICNLGKTDLLLELHEIEKLKRKA